LVGDTAKQVIEAYGQQTPWGKFTVLPVREIENLTPIELIKSLKAEKKKGLVDLLNHAQQHSDSIWKYIDLKDGLQVRKWKKIPRTSSERILVTNLSNKKCVSDLCENKNACAEKCDCVIFAGFGAQITEALNRFTKIELRSSDIKNRYDHFQWEIIRELALEAATWCCRRDPFLT